MGHEPIKPKQNGTPHQTYRGLWHAKNPRTNQHEVNGQKQREKFDDDHDNVLDATERGHCSSWPRRAVFGLLHNYFFIH